MATNRCVLMVLLICSDCAYTGVKGDAIPTFFTSAGGQVTLPCTNVLSEDCSSTTWIYNNGGYSSGTTEEVGHGLVKPNSPTNRSKRLRVASNCSLNIANATAEDVGLYTCQQFLIEGAQQEGDDAPVYLAVLQMSASSEVTEIEPGSEVTLQCLLLTHDKCKRTVENKLKISWVDKENRELHRTSNRHIQTSSVCNITIAEKPVDLKPSERWRSWTCRLTADGQVKASTTYSIQVKASTEILEDRTVFIIVGVLVACLLSTILVIVVICKKRANSERRAQNNVNEIRLCDMASESNQPFANDQSTDDLLYASIDDHLNQEQSTNHARKSPVDTQMYSYLMPPSSDETENRGSVDHGGLYATVQK
ncbi:uncharacterized protein LOC134098312 [Sardina pilchardus]|uniref:uncharacterized protein LOC134098312 n=1 Tax=Sardina pilchardus TaxID=27697 RepID=UPI002E111CD2